MKKGITPVISIIILLLIAVGLIGSFYTFISTTTGGLKTSGEEQIQQITKQISSCIRIDSIYDNKIYLRNCGNGVIKNDSLGIYLGNSPLTYFLKEDISENSIGEVNIWRPSIFGKPTGSVQLRINSGFAQDSRLVDSHSPSGVVMYLGFDEGSGNVAHDPVNGINWTLGTGDTWSDGVKYGGIKVDTGWWAPDSFGTRDVKTVSLYFKHDTTDTTGTFVCFGKSGGVTMEIGMENGYISYNAHFNGANHKITDNTKYLADGNWHKLVVTQDLSGVKYYVDDLTTPLLQSNSIQIEMTGMTYTRINGGCGYGYGDFDQIYIDEYYFSSDALSTENSEGYLEQL